MTNHLNTVYSVHQQVNLLTEKSILSSSQKSFLGRGALGKLEEVLTETSAESVFLVKSPDAYEVSGAHLLVDQALAKVKTSSFDGFTPNPKWPDILSAL
ncbi:uncharacterized protein METZ01_LOCUS469574, partial [marine metagenome]